MAQPERPGFTFQPPCPNCGNNMWLLLAEELIPGQQNRTFWCKICKTEQTQPAAPEPVSDPEQHTG